MANYMQSDFKLAGPLAGLFGGIQQAQEQEGKGLQNAYQMLKNQEQEYTSAEAQAKLQDPRYIQMKLENDMTKMGKEIPLNQLEAEYNVANRALSHLKVAAASSPQELQKVAGMYMQQLKIDPNSQEGQMIMQDPVAFAEKTVQMLAASATKNPEYMRQYGLQEQKDIAAKERTGMEVAGRKEVAGINANAQMASSKYTADKGLTGNMLGYAKDLRGELDNINTNITKLEGKEMDTAIFDAFRASGKTNATQDDVDKYKSAQLEALRKRKTEVEGDLSEARGAVRGRIGLGQGQGAGTKDNPIKL